jgi:NitT/TauT family transport system substrate-binding protein
MITAEDKIADVLTKYPQLKDKLLERSPKFKNLNNPVVFNTVGKFVRIADVAKTAGEDLDELLAFLNSHI